MSDCEKYQPYLAGLADDDLGGIPAEVAAGLRLHVKACPSCQAELARQTDAMRLFAADVPPAVPAARWQQVWQQVEAETTGESATQPVRGCERTTSQVASADTALVRGDSAASTGPWHPGIHCPQAGRLNGGPVPAQTAATVLRRRFAWRALAGVAGIAAMILAAVLLWPVRSSSDRQMAEGSAAVPVLAFATAQDNDIQMVDSSAEEAEDQSTIVITTGQENVVVVWVVQDEESKRST